MCATDFSKGRGVGHMANNNEAKMTALAGLTHDIGKFKQRASLTEDRGMTHAQIGYAWLSSQYGEGIIAAAARNHHGNEPETWMSNLTIVIYEADNCAASERRSAFDPKIDTGQAWHRSIQLAGVFSRVSNPEPDGRHQDPPQSYIPLGKTDRWTEPVREEEENTTKSYKKLWEEFEAEFSVIREANNHLNVDVVMHLLEKYTSSIPSITLKVFGDETEQTYRKHPDVSLFDHLKITSAAAVCLLGYHRYHEEGRWDSAILKKEIAGEESWTDEKHPFLLIGGDLSGVQNFIYTISSKGALRTLKGRSFFLELLIEHTVDRLLEEAGLFRSNVIFTGGGHFYVIAPHTTKSIQAVRNVRAEVNSYLQQAFNGDLQMFIEAVSFGKRTFKDSTMAWAEIAGRLDEVKRRRWEGEIASFLCEPKMPHETCLIQNCAVCGREDEPLRELSENNREVLVCRHCRDQYRLGGLLQDSARRGRHPVICRWDSSPGNERSIQIGSRYYQVAVGMFGVSKEQASEEAPVVFHLNDWDLTRFTHPGSRPLLAGVYLPSDEGCRELEGMVAGGFGMGNLGALRMDVDHLGRIFSSAIPEGERTLSRMASLSRQLSLFFKYHINGLMENSEGYPRTNALINRSGERRLSVVYAGGDDLFLIGHWLDITEAAFDIKDAFARFVANPCITISAGIALGGEHEPVYRLANEAGYAEDTAKGNNRRSITLFSAHTLRWEEADAALRLTKELMNFSEIESGQLRLSQGSISAAVLYKLLAITRKQKKDKAWIMPKLAYLFGRSFPNGDKYKNAWSRLKDYVFSTNADWRQLEVAILWNLMMMRRGGD